MSASMMNPMPFAMFKMFRWESMVSRCSFFPYRSGVCIHHNLVYLVDVLVCRIENTDL